MSSGINRGLGGSNKGFGVSYSFPVSGVNGSIKQSKPNGKVTLPEVCKLLWKCHQARSLDAGTVMVCKNRICFQNNTYGSNNCCSKVVLNQRVLCPERPGCCCDCGETELYQVVVSQACFNEVTMVEAEVPI